MNAMDLPPLDHALLVAANAHAGQRDKADQPYLYHIVAVVQRCRPGVEQVIAALHDILEDTEWTAEELKSHGFSSEVIAGVVALTRVSGESYEAYLHRLVQTPHAANVKWADVQDHLDGGPLASDVDGQLYTRYQKAAQFLTSHITEGPCTAPAGS